LVVIAIGFPELNKIFSPTTTATPALLFGWGGGDPWIRRRGVGLVIPHAQKTAYCGACDPPCPKTGYHHLYLSPGLPCQRKQNYEKKKLKK